MTDEQYVKICKIKDRCHRLENALKRLDELFLEEQNDGKYYQVNIVYDYPDDYHSRLLFEKEEIEVLRNYLANELDDVQKQFEAL